MDVIESISALLAHIETLSAPPVALSQLDSRFATLTADAVQAAPVIIRASSSNDYNSNVNNNVNNNDSGWVSRIPNERGRALAPAIEAAAAKYHLEPAFLAAVFWTESSYHPDAVSRTGAVGLGQLMPETASWLGVDPKDPIQNIDGSARYYRMLIDRNGGDMRLAIASYAAGPTAVKRAGGVPDEFIGKYIAKVIGRTDYIAGRSAVAP